MKHSPPHRVTSMPAGVVGGAVSPATRSIRLAGEHFAAATLYLLAGSIGLVWIAPELAAGNYLSPHVAGVTHLFTLLVLGLVAGIVVFVSGFFYKIVPLLAWTARYSGTRRTRTPPSVAQLFSARVAEIQLGVMVTALGGARGGTAS